MNAEEYLKGLNEHDPVFEIDTEYEYTERQLINFAERYHQKKLKLLGIGGVSKSFASGAKVQITHCIKGHEFEIGEIVEIVDYHKDDLWLAKSLERSNQQWYINEEEASVC